MEGKIFRANFSSSVASRIEDYKNKEELSTDSAVIRKLVTFALDIIDSSADAPAVSNRVIFEELLYLAKSNSSLISQAHICSYRNDVADDIKLESREARKAARDHGKNQTEIFLSGKD